MTVKEMGWCLFCGTMIPYIPPQTASMKDRVCNNCCEQLREELSAEGDSPA